MKVPAFFRAMRPQQWVKNILVPGPLLFAAGDATVTLPPGAGMRTLGATALFCLMSSAIYLFNDVRDRDLDRHHPRKKYRPVASGELSPRHALTGSFLLGFGSLIAAALWSLPLAGVLLTYWLLQFAYALSLKHMAYLDVMALSLGFVLRAVAGAVALPVPMSYWLLLCTFLLALFLALCKRRQEKQSHPATEPETRPSLKQVSIKGIDLIIHLVMGLSVISYTAYALADSTYQKYGHYRMLWTLPFVAIGLLRYRHMVFSGTHGERPEKHIFTDPCMLACVLGYIATVLVIL